MARPDVLTVTPNPSLDLLHETATIVWDDANRVAPPRVRPGGQGINVARAVIALGGTARALAPLGGPTGDQIAAMLAAADVPYHRIPSPAETRTFAAIRETATGRSLLINPRGEDMAEAVIAALLDGASDTITKWQPRWVACCGSLPPGAPSDLYATIGSHARAAGSLFTADCDGDALRLAAEAGCDLLVPNCFEVERLTGLAAADPADAVEAARSLVRAGTPTVAITLGGRGAVLVTRDYAGHARAREEIRQGSAVGAGDAFLACLMLRLAAGVSPGAALRDGVAAGTAVLSGTGSDLLDLRTFEKLRPMVELKEML
ncbi:MAG: hexose kinase [Longimicrobiales bacterium]